jgi:hypothetical protein
MPMLEHHCWFQRTVGARALPLLTLLLCGCTAKVDGTSESAFTESLERVRASLPVDQRAAFDEAVALAARPSFDLTGSLEYSPVSAAELRDRLDGRSGEQVLALGDSLVLARDAEELKALRYRKADADSMRLLLSQLRIVSQPRLLHERFGYETFTRLQVSVRNETPHAIASIIFEGSLGVPGRQIPIQEGAIYVQLEGGLEPNEVRALDAFMSEQWDLPEAPPRDAVLTIRPSVLVGARQETIAVEPTFSLQDSVRLIDLEGRIGNVP